ncbi:hypothetical protein ACP70R_028081 [Stipagrostis hirtigluma subsp. patula]
MPVFSSGSGAVGSGGSGCPYPRCPDLDKLSARCHDAAQTISPVASLSSAQGPLIQGCATSCHHHLDD